MIPTIIVITATAITTPNHEQDPFGDGGSAVFTRDSCKVLYQKDSTRPLA
jgi:hypothetical protein